MKRFQPLMVSSNQFKQFNEQAIVFSDFFAKKTNRPKLNDADALELFACLTGHGCYKAIRASLPTSSSLCDLEPINEDRMFFMVNFLNFEFGLEKKQAVDLLVSAKIILFFETSYCFEKSKECFKELLNKKNGLLVFSGGVGSGKLTILNLWVEYLKIKRDINKVVIYRELDDEQHILEAINKSKDCLVVATSSSYFLKDNINNFGKNISFEDTDLCIMESSIVKDEKSASVTISLDITRPNL